MIQKTQICAIVAVGPENVIGKNNVMPWYCPADLRHFRLTTMGHPCIFGKKTFIGMGNQPLDNRINIVCSSQYTNEMINKDYWRVSSIEYALNVFKNNPKIFVCGGSQIYKYVLDNDLVDVFYLTKITNPHLQKQVQEKPTEYTYFPVNIDNFFANDKWIIEKIIYPVEFFKTDARDIQLTFLKYTKRIR